MERKRNRWTQFSKFPCFSQQGGLHVVEHSKKHDFHRASGSSQISQQGMNPWPLLSLQKCTQHRPLIIRLDKPLETFCCCHINKKWVVCICHRSTLLNNTALYYAQLYVCISLLIRHRGIKGRTRNYCMRLPAPCARQHSLWQPQWHHWAGK